MPLKSVLPGSSFEICHHSMVTGAALGDAVGAGVAAWVAGGDVGALDALGLGVALLEHAPNSRAMTLSTPASRQLFFTPCPPVIPSSSSRRLNRS